MKFYDTHFDEYLEKIEKYNLHEKYKQYYNDFPDCLSKMKNLIFYGPSGIGKYSQMLYYIKKYSPSKLKYEKNNYLQEGCLIASTLLESEHLKICENINEIINQFNL